MTQENRAELVISALNETQAAFRNLQDSLKKLEGDIKKIDQSAKTSGTSFNKSMKDAASGTGLFAGALSGLIPLLGSLGIVFSAATAVAWIKQTIDAADAIEDMAEKTGAGISGLSELNYIGDVVGVSMESLSIGLKQLAKNLYAAREGGKEQAKVFKQLLGEQWQVITANKSTDEVLRLVAGGFSTVDDEATKVALAMKVFRKSGSELLPILNLGTKGLAEMSNEARALGIVFTEDAAKAAAQFNENLATLKASFKGIGVSLVNNVMMPLVQFMKTTMQAQVTWMAFMDKLALVDKFRWSGLIGSNRGELKRQMAIVDEAAFGQINEIEAKFTPRQLPQATGGAGGGGTGGTGKTGRTSRPGKTADSYDLNAAKREGGLYEWRDILEATDALSQFTFKLKAPELQQPIFNLGFTAVEFESLEAQQEKAAEAQRVQQEEMALTEDSLRELARRYDETFGIKIPSAIEGTNMALVDYARMAADSTTQAFSAMYNALGGLEDALTDFVTTGKADFKGLIDSILKDVARMTTQKTITGPLSNLLSNGLSSLFGGGSLNSRVAQIEASGGFEWLKNAKGNAFASPDLSQYSGSVVTKPTFFKFAYGDALGVMGEGRDYEGIFPLARDKSGKLGVRAMGGGGGSSLTINIPLTVEGGGKKLASELRRDIEDLVVRKVKDLS